MTFYSKTPHTGFTLVETLVAISILLIVIVGPMTITSRTAKSTTFSSEQVTAFFLAQEGAELAQKARDELLLKNFLDTSSPTYIANPWARFVTGSTYASCFTPNNQHGCRLEATDLGGVSVAACSAATTDCRLYLDTVTPQKRSRFTYESTPGTLTPFRRVIRMTRSGDEVRVVSEVTWRTGSLAASQRVQVETYLVNIYATP